MDAETAKDLRAKFPPGAVGKLPKPYKKDSERGNCPECGGYHGLPAAHLDYVGHAAVTDRLLKVDPTWTWEPLGLDEFGLPAMDKAGNLWIRLTVAGVTRVGVGDGASMKERIGDAIRNAAMRFGVALDLWTKEDLDLHDMVRGEARATPPPPEDRPTPSKGVSTKRMSRSTNHPDAMMTPEQNAHMFALLGERGITNRDERLAGISKVVGREITTTKDMTRRDASLVINSLKGDASEPFEESA